MKHVPQSLDARRIRKAFWFSPLIGTYIIFFLFILGMTAREIATADSIYNALGSLINFFAGALILSPTVLVAAIVPYCHILFIALPLFFIMKKHLYITRSICVTSGFIIGFLPYVLYALLAKQGGTEILSIGSLFSIFIIGTCGAIIGYFFWRIGIKPVDSK